MISQVISLASMCFFNFWDRPIVKEVMNIYVMQSQSFCEDTYDTPKGVWSWDWRKCNLNKAFKIVYDRAIFTQLICRAVARSHQAGWRRKGRLKEETVGPETCGRRRVQKSILLPNSAFFIARANVFKEVSDTADCQNNGTICVYTCAHMMPSTGHAMAIRFFSFGHQSKHKTLGHPASQNPKSIAEFIFSRMKWLMLYNR